MPKKQLHKHSGAFEVPEQASKPDIQVPTTPPKLEGWRESSWADVPPPLHETAPTPYPKNKWIISRGTKGNYNYIPRVGDKVPNKPGLITPEAWDAEQKAKADAWNASNLEDRNAAMEAAWDDMKLQRGLWWNEINDRVGRKPMDSRLGEPMRDRYQRMIDASKEHGIKIPWKAVQRHLDYVDQDTIPPGYDIHRGKNISGEEVDIRRITAPKPASGLIDPSGFYKVNADMPAQQAPLNNAVSAITKGASDIIEMLHPSEPSPSRVESPAETRRHTPHGWGSTRTAEGTAAIAKAANMQALHAGLEGFMQPKGRVQTPQSWTGPAGQAPNVGGGAFGSSIANWTGKNLGDFSSLGRVTPGGPIGPGTAHQFGGMQVEAEDAFSSQELNKAAAGFDEPRGIWPDMGKPADNPFQPPTPKAPEPPPKPEMRPSAWEGVIRPMEEGKPRPYPTGRVPIKMPGRHAGAFEYAKPTNLQGRTPIPKAEWDAMEAARVKAFNDRIMSSRMRDFGTIRDQNRQLDKEMGQWFDDREAGLHNDPVPAWFDAADKRIGDMDDDARHWQAEAAKGLKDPLAPFTHKELDFILRNVDQPIPVKDRWNAGTPEEVKPDKPMDKKGTDKLAAGFEMPEMPTNPPGAEPEITGYKTSPYPAWHQSQRTVPQRENLAVKRRGVAGGLDYVPWNKMTKDKWQRHVPRVAREEAATAKSEAYNEKMRKHYWRQVDEVINARKAAMRRYDAAPKGTDFDTFFSPEDTAALQRYADLQAHSDDWRHLIDHGTAAQLNAAGVDYEDSPTSTPGKPYRWVKNRGELYSKPYPIFKNLPKITSPRVFQVPDTNPFNNPPQLPDPDHPAVVRLKKNGMDKLAATPELPETIPLPHKPRKRTYVGRGSLTTKDEIDKTIRDFEARTGTNLDKMPVLSDKRQIMRNFGRYYFPKTFRQIPSRMWHAAKLPLTTAIAPITPLPLILELENILAHATAGKGDFYVPGTGAVNVGKGHIPTLAHEAGHWVDYETSGGPYRHGWLSGHKDSPLRKMPNMPAEMAATLWARQAMGEDEWKKSGEKTLYPALATYINYNRNFARRRLGEVLKGAPKISKDPDWQKNLAAAMKGDDPKAVDVAFRRALRSIVPHRTFDPNQIMSEDEETGDLAWAKKMSPKAKQLKKLTTMLMETEWKRLQDARAKEKAKEEEPLRKAAADKPRTGTYWQHLTGQTNPAPVQARKSPLGILDVAKSDYNDVKNWLSPKKKYTPGYMVEAAQIPGGFAFPDSKRKGYRMRSYGVGETPQKAWTDMMYGSPSGLGHQHPEYVRTLPNVRWFQGEMVPEDDIVTKGWEGWEKNMFPQSANKLRGQPAELLKGKYPKGMDPKTGRPPSFEQRYKPSYRPPGWPFAVPTPNQYRKPIGPQPKTDTADLKGSAPTFNPMSREFPEIKKLVPSIRDRGPGDYRDSDTGGRVIIGNAFSL